MSTRSALNYMAEWFAYEMAGNEVTILDFDPPREFVDRVAAELVRNPKLAWPDEDSARSFLGELWPDCNAARLAA